MTRVMTCTIAAFLTGCLSFAPSIPSDAGAPMDAGIVDAGPSEPGQSVVDACMHLCDLTCSAWCPISADECASGLQTLIDSESITIDVMCLSTVASCDETTNCSQ